MRGESKHPSLPLARAERKPFDRKIKHSPRHQRVISLKENLALLQQQKSDVEQELDDIAVLDDIFLALGALQALGLDGSIVEVVGLEVAVADDAGTDETALEIAVDLTGSLRGLGALADGPCAALLLAVGQEGDEAQQVVAGGDEVVEAAGLDAHLGEEGFLLLGGVVGDVLLGLGADGDVTCTLFLGACSHQRDVLVVFDALHQVVLAHVAGVEDGLAAQQAHLVEHGLLLGVALVEVEAAGGLAAFQMSSKLLQPCSLGGGSLVVAALCSLGHPACAVLNDLEVGEDQLIVDGVDVRDGVHGFGLGHILHDMDDVVVVKATHHMDDGVALADVAEEFVAEACALTCALHEACDVHELHDGGGLLVGLPDLSQLVQPLVGHGHDAAVRLDGAEGIVCGLRVLGGGDGIEQSGLADVGQADDT